MNLDDFSEEKRKKLDDYFSLLFSFNEKFNLTSFKDKEEVLTKGVLPLLKIVEMIKEGNCLDIGSGSGIPAIPLAIFCEKTNWTLLEPSQKKAGFLVKTSISLNLPVKVVSESAENFFKRTKKTFSIATARGVKLNSRIVEGIRRHLEEGGKFFLFTGKDKEKDYQTLFNRSGFDLRFNAEDHFAAIMGFVPRGTKSKIEVS